MLKVKSLSRVLLFVTPWIIAYQAPPSMGFSRQEYTELYKKDLHDQDKHDGMITDLEPDPGMWSQVGLRKHYYEQS